MQDLLFTSDLHFHHKNIITHCNRPFSSVEEMEETLIQNWNSKVKLGDVIYCLGDFAFMNKKNVDHILSRLNGEKHLVRGNHDNRLVTGSPHWASVKDLAFLKLKPRKVSLVLCHYPFLTWRNSRHGSINLFGHMHGTMQGNRQQLDVGVDAWNMFPATLEEIQERLKTLPERSVVYD